MKVQFNLLTLHKAEIVFIDTCMIIIMFHFSTLKKIIFICSIFSMNFFVPEWMRVSFSHYLGLAVTRIRLYVECVSVFLDILENNIEIN